ncbi:MAG: hypothetical protein RMZ69_08375 [Nostoc sp. ChiQUE01a]|nr:hypothetical protein [Nostoc sp. ChiQUE01a]
MSLLPYGGKGLPTSEEIESRLFELISPGTFANLKGVKDKERSLRDAYGGLCLRVLTLPVMAAIVLSLVYRQIQHLKDVLRCLEVEGLLWVGPSHKSFIPCSTDY